jgi:hypothetical protein
VQFSNLYTCKTLEKVEQAMRTALYLDNLDNALLLVGKGENMESYVELKEMKK